MGQEASLPTWEPALLTDYRSLPEGIRPSEARSPQRPSQHHCCHLAD